MLPLLSMQLYSHAKEHLLHLGPKGAYVAISSLTLLKYVDPTGLASLLDNCKKGWLPTWTLQELSSLMAALARNKVRPSNAWLAALMQVGWVTRFIRGLQWIM